MRPVRVLQVLNEAGPTTRRFVLPLARLLLERGCQVTCALSDGPYLDDYRDIGCDVVPVPVSRRAWAAANAVSVWELAKLMRRGFHVVHTHTLFASLLARSAARVARPPTLIYHARGTYFGEGPARRIPFTMMERALRRANSAILTLNASDALDYTRLACAPPGRIRNLGVGGLGIDLAEFNPARFTDSKLAAVRDALGIPRAGFMFGFVGRMVAAKGINELLEAFRQLREQLRSDASPRQVAGGAVVAARPDVHLLMVGGVLSTERDQVTFSALQERVAAHGLKSCVHFTGFQTDIAPLLAACDAVVMPSYAEGFGMTLAEAAALAKPVITTGTRGGTEAVVPGVTGLIVPPRSVAALRAAMERLVLDPAAARGLGEQARCRAQTRFDETRVLAEIEALYLELIAERWPGATLAGIPVSESAAGGKT